MVEERLGLPLPLSVAELVVTLVAGTVKAVGDEGVMNDWTAPSAVPIALAARAQ